MELGDWVGAGTNLFGTVTSYFSNQSNANALRDQANASRDASNAQADAIKYKADKDLEALKLQLAAGGQKKSDNTLLYVGLGVGGVIVIGLIAYAATRK